jgi:hypothetical protein
VDEAEQERRKELSKYAGPREFFRLGCFIMGWFFLGLIIGLTLTLVFNIKEEIGIAVFIVFSLAVFALPILGYYWKPANSLMNKVVGNKNFSYPILPIPTGRLTFEKRPWYYYITLLWRYLLLILLMYLVIKYFTK